MTSLTEKKVEELIRKSEARFRSIIELTEQYEWTTDADGKVVEDLSTLAQFTGFREEDLKGWGWLKVIHPDDRESAEKAWKEAVTHTVKYETEYRVRRFDGVYRHFLARGVPILKDDGSVEEWVGICIDLSERKKLETMLQKSHEELEKRVYDRTVELNEKRQELESLNKELLKEIDQRKKFELDLKDKGEKILVAYRQRDLLSKKLVELLEKERHEISSTLHDQIGQILTGMTIQLEKLKKIPRVEGSKLSDRVEPIQGLLRDLILKTKKISLNLRSDVIERFGLIASVRQLIEDVQEQSGLKIQLFTKNVPDDLKEGGKDLAVYRIIQESLTNVVKHAKAKEVFINIIQKGKYLSLTIEDDGVGFDRNATFKQGDLQNNPLGITIMRERVSMLGGEFRIESRPGKGVLIIGELPLAAL